MPRTLTVDQITKQTEYNKRTIYRWIKSGKVEAEKIGRMWFVDGESLAAYLAEIAQADDRRFGPKNK